MFLGGEEKQHGHKALEEGMHSTGLYRQNYNGARAIFFAWLMLADFLVFFLFNSCLPCWAQNSDRAINEPANPQPPPRVVLPAELNCRGACEMFQFVCKREFVSWACMVDGSHKKREGGVFWRLKSRRVEPP